MERDSQASDSQRLVYRDPAYLWIGVPLLALGLFLVIGSLSSIIIHWLHNEPVFGKHGFQSLLFGYVLEIAILVLGVRSCTEQQLVIEREYNRITKIKKVFIWKQSEVFDIRSFDTVSWRSESKSDGDHRRIRYPITLSGLNSRVDLFEEVSKSDALQVVAEIKEFLQLQQTQDEEVYVPTEGEIKVSSGTAYLMVKGFTIVWYLFCSIFVLMGLLFAGTAGWAVLKGEMETSEGLAFVSGSLLFTAVAVAFFFLGRKSFPTMLEKVEEKVASEQAKRAAPTIETAENLENQEGSGFADSEKKSISPDPVRSVEANRWKRLKWLFIILGLMLGCETRVATNHDGEEVAIRERPIFPWNDHPSATELAKEIDPEKFVKIRVSRTYAFGMYSSSSSATVPRASQKRISKPSSSKPTPSHYP